MENYERVPMISQPAELNVGLYPHQLASVYNMERLERDKRIDFDESSCIETRIGINADITGFGKSLAMVALILRDRMEWDLNRSYVTESSTTYSAGNIVKKFRQFHEKIDATIILVNQSIVSQWQKEFSHAPSLRVATVTTRKVANTVDPTLVDVIIVTPTMFNRLVDRYYGMAWKRFIYDEPGHIRVPSMRTIISGFTWFVTATPRSILSQHRSCYSSFMYNLIGEREWISHGYVFDDVTIANDEKFIRASFEMPPTHHTYHTCFSGIYNTVQGIVSDRILAMIDANDIHGTIAALGGKKTKNITELVRSKKEQELEEISSKIRIYTLRDDEKRVSEWCQRKKRVEAQIAELDKRYSELLSKPCGICYDVLNNPVMEPNCQNVFCAKCLLTWLKGKNTCPLCRNVVSLDELVYVTVDAREEKKSQKIPSKEEKILELIVNNPTGRFIVFSSYAETFNRVRRVFKSNSIPYLEVKGGIGAVNRKIEKFKQGEIRVAFLNSKYQGAGLNLQEATDIIIYHSMADDMISQIVGRANRIGRKCPLRVHHLRYGKCSEQK